jgi:hypothetical protein
VCFYFYSIDIILYYIIFCILQCALFQEEDIKRTLEESACLQRSYERFIDKVIVNEDFDETFRTVIELLDTLSNKHQWVPVNWVY